MPDDDEQRPQGPPDAAAPRPARLQGVSVTAGHLLAPETGRGRPALGEAPARGRARRPRRARAHELRPRAPRGAVPTAAEAALEASRGTRPAPRAPQAAGAADRLLAGDRDRRLDRDQPALLRGLGPAAVLQALRRSQGRPARQPVHPAERAEHPRHGHRRPSGQHQGTGRGQQPQVLRAAGKGRVPALTLLAGRIPRRHPDGDPGGRRHLQQTLDPPRLLRRNPRQAADENQRRLRLRRRRAADQDGRKVPQHQDRPRRDHQLHRPRKPGRRGRRRPGRPEAQALLDIVGGAGGGQGGSPCTWGRARTR